MFSLFEIPDHARVFYFAPWEKVKYLAVAASILHGLGLKVVAVPNPSTARVAHMAESARKNFARDY